LDKPTAEAAKLLNVIPPSSQLKPGVKTFVPKTERHAGVAVATPTLTASIKTNVFTALIVASARCAKVTLSEHLEQR
jgi:hypothetical protein